MFKISNKLSLNLSIVISVVFFAVCIAGAFVLPELAQMLIDLPDNIGNRGDITETGRTLVLVTAYLVLGDFILADFFLFVLLQRVKGGKVFTEKSVSLIRGVSWCCFLLCLLFCFLGYYFQLAYIVAFLGFFLGLCLRVTKNVVEEATIIKDENDLTV